MKSRIIYGIVVILLVLGVFSGCKPSTPAPVVREPEPYQPPPVQPAPVQPVTQEPEPAQQGVLVPLTLTILQRMGDSNNKLRETIGDFQLVLSGGILLEDEYTTRRDGWGEGGSIRFQETNTRNTVLIRDQTEGVALDLILGSENILPVCFEDDLNMWLQFSAEGGNLDGYFYLKYNPNIYSSPNSDDQGIVQYGGKSYRVRFSGNEKPYLMIWLSQGSVNLLNEHIAPGRKVGQSSRSH